MSGENSEITVEIPLRELQELKKRILAARSPIVKFSDDFEKMKIEAEQEKTQGLFFAMNFLEKYI